jgi:hypothetical protein
VGGAILLPDWVSGQVSHYLNRAAWNDVRGAIERKRYDAAWELLQAENARVDAQRYLEASLDDEAPDLDFLDFMYAQCLEVGFDRHGVSEQSHVKKMVVNGQVALVTRWLAHPLCNDRQRALRAEKLLEFPEGLPEEGPPYDRKYSAALRVAQAEVVRLAVQASPALHGQALQRACEASQWQPSQKELWGCQSPMLAAFLAEHKETVAALMPLTPEAALPAVVWAVLRGEADKATRVAKADAAVLHRWLPQLLLAGEVQALRQALAVAPLPADLMVGPKEYTGPKEVVGAWFEAAAKGDEGSRDWPRLHVLLDQLDDRLGELDPDHLRRYKWLDGDGRSDALGWLVGRYKAAEVNCAVWEGVVSEVSYREEEQVPLRQTMGCAAKP